MGMAANNTILCIHRDPEQLSLLQENGYELVTATNGHDGLRLFASQPVDAIVLDYHLGLLDGAAVANEIKRVRPTVPIVMLADNLELPDGALNSVDALVTKSDGAHFLWATVHFVLNVKPAQRREGKLETHMRAHLCPSGSSTGQADQLRAKASPGLEGAPFTAKEWRSIRAGTVRF
jgi:DNA-binding response OmpR family regulator